MLVTDWVVQSGTQEPLLHRASSSVRPQLTVVLAGNSSSIRLHAFLCERFLGVRFQLCSMLAELEGSVSNPALGTASAFRWEKVTDGS
jgi:hypothetical protein